MCGGGFWTKFQDPFILFQDLFIATLTSTTEGEGAGRRIQKKSIVAKVVPVLLTGSRRHVQDVWQSSPEASVLEAGQQEKRTRAVSRAVYILLASKHRQRCQ